MQDAIDFMNDNSLQINRFWVGRFGEHNSETPTFQHQHSNKRDSQKQKDSSPLKKMLNVTLMRRDSFITCTAPFVWDENETHVGISKKYAPREVIVSKRTQSATVTIAENYHESQLTLLAAI
jgi:hypothetical protein